MRRSMSLFGVWGVLREELNKIPAMLHFHANESVDAAKRAGHSLKNVYLDENPELAEKRKKHRESYEEILRQQQQRAKEASEESLRGLSFMERIKKRVVSVNKALKEATSTNAGAMALLQHCTASHAAEVAVEEGIDVKNVTLQLEKKKTGTQVGYETVVVGYIDAPKASEAEVMAFAEKLQKRCPVANSMKGRIEWRSVSSTTPKADGGNKDEGTADAIPMGTPGFRRYVSSTAKGVGGGLQDPDELHLPGSKPCSDEKRDK
ncbi:hypothetical protein TraAM80_02370 [Trypanosoma rangeli]|uniref:OsmC-like protein n=1 Tax=Trypanosoma rangeli TaxID=5698 RepID=A0A422NU27_TRYRA|nr:uncharacterized protein TraAM80_02370 [Trypanosoma rangeli]RNF08962.1 hypothetical protein TraAM80_02370 [Trypanosoma rangeli]|eukprot:RNF08962.1 hypothetical protein TraAM80_02370 [Trypanosoma rangeli]